MTFKTMKINLVVKSSCHLLNFKWKCFQGLQINVEDTIYEISSLHS